MNHTRAKTMSENKLTMALKGIVRCQRIDRNIEDSHERRRSGGGRGRYVR